MLLRLEIEGRGIRHLQGRLDFYIKLRCAVRLKDPTLVDRALSFVAVGDNRFDLYHVFESVCG